MKEERESLSVIVFSESKCQLWKATACKESIQAQKFQMSNETAQNINARAALELVESTAKLVSRGTCCARGSTLLATHSPRA